VKIRSSRLTNIITWCLGKLFRLIARTVRYRIIEECPGINPAADSCKSNYLYAIWHDQAIIPITYRVNIPRSSKALPAMALVSRHQDGSWLTGFMKQFGVGAIRGSSSRGGAVALRKLFETSQESHIFITPDGPRGPRHKVKQGIVYLASQTGIPIVVNANAITRCWNIEGSWTNQIVPKPFARAYILMSKPIEVPADLSREDLEHYQQLIEAEFERLQTAADRLARGEISEWPQEEPAEDTLSLSDAA